MFDIFQKLFSRLKPLPKEKKPAVVSSPGNTEDIPIPPEPAPKKESPLGILAITCIGHSHIKHGTVCQDSSLCHQGENFRLIVVSDGHGSTSFPRSDRGSRLACDAAREVCTEFTQRGLSADREQAARELCNQILDRWRTAVLDDYAQDPFDEVTLEGVSEKYRAHYQAGRHVVHAYGATLIAVLEAPFGTLALRCGDGECIAIDAQGNFSRPIPWNEKCDANVTTSLCDADAMDEFRWVWLDEPMAAIWISTDGVDNSYPRPEDLDEFYANLSTRVWEQGCDHVIQDLQQFLPVLTQRCSQDDISVAAMIDHAILATAHKRLHAYVELCQALRDLDELRRRMKLNSRALQEKERILAREIGSRDALYREICTFREEENRLNQELSALEAKLAQLRLDAGISAGE